MNRAYRTAGPLLVVVGGGAGGEVDDDGGFAEGGVGLEGADHRGPGGDCVVLGWGGPAFVYACQPPTMCAYRERPRPWLLLEELLAGAAGGGLVPETRPSPRGG